MLDYGTKIVAGVTPGKAGLEVEGIPVYDSVKDTLAEHSVDASIMFVPAAFARDAALEAISSSIELLVVVTEMIPAHHAFQIREAAEKAGVKMVGPNTPGIITPGKSKVGIMPSHVFKPGEVGVVSRSGTLMYEIASTLSSAGVGQSTCIGVGGDRIVGLRVVDVLKLFKEDPATKAVTIIGEIGGGMEEEAAQYIAATKYPKPVAAFIAGRTAPPEKRMGHAGAIITGDIGTFKSKLEALEAAGVEVAKKPSEVAETLRKVI
ncbi:MAG: succinate--CoA ligase subunit alpha, partial [Aigarchaeota archaeon]|nr:succinate--CoA ligase subunit alpha [Aigarchaeota archaeon]